MMEIHDLHFPDNSLCFQEHEWVFRDGINVKIDISDYTQDRLGDCMLLLKGLS